MWGISRGFVLIKDGGDRSRKDFWVHFGTLERTQVVESVLLLIKSIHGLIEGMDILKRQML